MRGFGGGPAPYTPVREIGFMEWWDVAHGGLVAGAVNTWTGLGGTVATWSGTTHDYSAAALANDQGVTYPGITVASAMLTEPIGALRAGKTRMVEILACTHVQNQLEVASEAGATYAVNGQQAILSNVAPDNPSGYEVYTAIQGGGGLGQVQSPKYALPNPDPFVLSLVWDLTATGLGITSIRVDGVEILPLCATITSALVAGSTFTNADQHLGARVGVTFPSQGVLVAHGFISNPTAAAITRAERYAAALFGQVTA